LENSAPCRATLRRLELSVFRSDMADLPHMAQVLADLPCLEHVEFFGYQYGEREDWIVKGGREALLKLMSDLAGLDSDDEEQLRTDVQRVLMHLYEMEVDSDDDSE
jgi:hypothetical protein